MVSKALSAVPDGGYCTAMYNNRPKMGAAYLWANEHSAQPPHRRPQRCLALSPIPDSDLPRQSPRGVSSPFSMQSIHTEYTLKFVFLHHVFYTREFLHRPSCAGYTVGWYARLGTLSTYSTYKTNRPIGWSFQTWLAATHTFHKLSIQSASSFQSNFLFGLIPA